MKQYLRINKSYGIYIAVKTLASTHLLNHIDQKKVFVFFNIVNSKLLKYNYTSKSRLDQSLNSCHSITLISTWFLLLNWHKWNETTYTCYKISLDLHNQNDDKNNIFIVDLSGWFYKEEFLWKDNV